MKSASGFSLLSSQIKNAQYHHHTGSSAAIHYGTGAISGFFSQENVKVGDLVVKNQVFYETIKTYVEKGAGECDEDRARNVFGKNPQPSWCGLYYENYTN